jgi:hypothetical protein
MLSNYSPYGTAQRGKSVMRYYGAMRFVRKLSIVREYELIKAG